MKAYKTITIISVILLAIVITVASFFGIYKLKEYKVKNVVPKYSMGMEFNKNRLIKLKVDDSVESTTVYDKDGNIVEQEEDVEYTEENGYTTIENKVNTEDELTKENYKLSKEILMKRLKLLKVNQYIIKQDENSGNMQIQIPEDDTTDTIVQTLMQVGKFELTDEETSEVLMNNSDIKNAVVTYGSTDATGTSTTVYLQIYFNEEGARKLEEISKVYVATTVQEENDAGELEDKEETKNVSILFDGQVYRTTYFGQTMTEGILNLEIGSGTKETELEDYIKTAGQISTMLNTGVMPIKYEPNQITMQPYVNSNCIDIVMYVAIAILAILYIYLIIKFKSKGLILSILQISYIALLLLTIRYTNVIITLEGIVGIIVSVVLNYIFNFAILNNVKKEEKTIKEIILKFLVALIPLYVISAVFTFISNANISSLGMTLFWGIAIMYLYNVLITKTTIEIMSEK